MLEKSYGRVDKFNIYDKLGVNINGEFIKFKICDWFYNLCCFDKI